MSESGVMGRNRLLTILCLGSLMFANPVLAATEVVSLERLKAPDIIYLPTVRSQYQIQFTKPKTWNISPNSQLMLEFQHSNALLPHRSWLQVILNDKVIKYIPLTDANAERTQMTLPLPVALLQDFNTLSFRVEQHYTDKCEDPLDKSLWTQVLPATKLVFNYTPEIPEVNLGLYPYPIVDPLTYSPVNMNYVISKSAGQEALLAMAMVNTHLAQAAGKKEMVTNVGNSAPQTAQHVAYIGKVTDVPEIQRYLSIVRQAGQPVSSSNGLIVYLQEAGSIEKTVLIVTGETDQAVLNAARYLTSRPAAEALLGQAAEVPTGWSPPDRGVLKPPRYITNESRTFKELELPITDVQKINAPPISYELPVLTDFKADPNAKLFMDLVYSYSPKLNPRYSSLELRLNNVSIANLPLIKETGENLKRTTVEIPRDLLKVNNELVAQFHLMPDKYGWCVDNYKDDSWGRIDDSSKFRVEGQPALRLPDVGLLNRTMYPYSLDDNLKSTRLVLPQSPTLSELDAMLAFTTRLGRATYAEGPLSLTLAQGQMSEDKGRHQVVFRMPGDSLSVSSLRMGWENANPLAGLLRTLNLVGHNDKALGARVMTVGEGTTIEQIMGGDNHAITVFSSEDSKGFQRLADLLESDKAFKDLPEGYLHQLSSQTTEINGIGAVRIHQEPDSPWWMQWLRWLQSEPWIVGAVAVLAGLLLIKIIARIIHKARYT